MIPKCKSVLNTGAAGRKPERRVTYGGRLSNPIFILPILMATPSPSGGSEGGSGRPRAALDSLFSICNVQSDSETETEGATAMPPAEDFSHSESEQGEGGAGVTMAQASGGGGASPTVRKTKMDSSSPSRGAKRSGKGKAGCPGQKRCRHVENLPPKGKGRTSSEHRASKAKPESGSSKGGKWKHRGKPGLAFPCTGDGKIIGEPKTVHWHPMLSVPVCDDCHYRYNEGSFEGEDEEAAELFCRWCGGGSEGTAFLCDACPKIWCEGCILRNLGRGILQKISGTEGIWKCFACNPGQLKPYRRSRASAWGLSFADLQRLEGDTREGKAGDKDGHGIGRNVVCEDISKGREPVPIPAVNDVDDEPFPGDTFTYVADFVSDSVHLGHGNPNQMCSCDCEDGCMDPSKCACAQMMGGEFPYTLQKKLTGQREAIYECNVFCACHAHGCANRVIGKGLGQRLQVFRCPEKRKGWGVRCIDDLQAGTFVIDYVGELITEKETEARKGQDAYIFSLDQAPNQYAWAGSLRNGEKEVLRQMQRESDAQEESGQGPPTTAFNTQLESFLKANWVEMFEHAESTNGRNIDALKFGNVARFINHSCEPNLILQVAFTDNQDIRHPRVGFFALADIPKGTELCYDYGYGSTHWNGKKKNMKCLCGARSCQGKTL